LSGVEATVDPHPDALISPEQPSGLHQCLDDLRRDFEVEDQDPAWISNELMNDCIARFFMFERSHEEYVCPIVFNGIAASEKPKITVVSRCLSQWRLGCFGLMQVSLIELLRTRISRSTVTWLVGEKWYSSSSELPKTRTQLQINIMDTVKRIPRIMRKKAMTVTMTSMTLTMTMAKVIETQGMITATMLLMSGPTRIIIERMKLDVRRKAVLVNNDILHLKAASNPLVTSVPLVDRSTIVLVIALQAEKVAMGRRPTLLFLSRGSRPSLLQLKSNQSHTDQDRCEWNGGGKGKRRKGKGKCFRDLARGGGERFGGTPEFVQSLGHRSGGKCGRGGNGNESRR
jgi:hypothetical protein